MSITLKYLSLMLVVSLLFACADNSDDAAAPEAEPKAELIPVTIDNYEFAESDLAFNNITKLVGTGQFYHFPVEQFDLNNQTVVRMNRDTIYSAAIADVSQGATLTLPEGDGRYMSVMIVQNDHYIDQVFTKPGTYDIESQTDYVMIALRIRANETDLDDARKIQTLQQAVQFSTVANRPHVMPNYDLDQLVALRTELAAEATAMGSMKNMQGAHGTVDKRMHLFGTAVGWGLLPDARASYLSYKPETESGEGCFQATYPVPPFNEPGFFSITMYDADGWIFSENAVLNEYNLEFNDDGTFDASFGDCGDGTKNNLPIVDGWNFTMRIYEPKLDELDRFTFPEAEEVD
jgi:hypothetical protein